MNSKTISDIANIALALSLIVGLIFGIAQVRVAVRDRRERLTLEMLRQFQTREFAELLFFITQHNFPCTRDEMQKMPANDQVMIIQFGQQMESLGMIVAEGLVNMDLVDKTLGSFVTTSWEKYKTLFLNIREVQSDPFLGEYFQWLAERIDRRMTECPRKPFNQK